MLFLDSYPYVMPGLVPGIHAFKASTQKDVGGRAKPGHDAI